MSVPNAVGIRPSSLVGGGRSVLAVQNETRDICNVWASNLDEEFYTIQRVIQRYKFVALDTEFPGVVLKPIGYFHSRADYEYAPTFMDEAGNKPPIYAAWQFNFKFSLTDDMYAQDSIDLLISSGIELERHEEEGIDPYEFAELFTVSGVVLSDDVKLISFHGARDMAYLLKMLTNRPLPADRYEFFELMRIYFPVLYDVKHITHTCTSLTGGLKALATKLELKQDGTPHQAGSDSSLTGEVFFKIRDIFFGGNIKNGNLCGALFGLCAS